MIEGLHFDFTSEELAKMLAEKIAHHESKAEQYRQQLDGLASLETGSGSVDAKRDFETHRNTHHGNAVTLTLLRTHLIPNETYRLTRDDLIEIGVLQRRW